MKRLPPHLAARLVTEALLEDVGAGDVTTQALVPEGLKARGAIRARDAIVLAGIDLAERTFRTLDEGAVVISAREDGETIPAGGTLLEIEADARALLTGERTALNFLGRLSGIATLTRRYVEACAPHRIEIADTRKTTPGLRILEKYAVACGGGTNHRFGLFDAILIKDNHVDLCGGVAPAVRRARAASGGALPVEVEVRSLEDLDEALASGADAVLIDNFPMDLIERAAARAKGRAFVEISGGVRLDTVARIAALGVDRVSIGALTHSAPSADLTMRITT